MKATLFISKSPQDTITLASKFARQLKAGDIVCLHGELGAGKTTFVKGLAKALKINPNAVNSPTFVLLNIYDGKLPVYHFDLYRIEGAELANLGYEEYFYGNGIAVIEWAERLKDQMPKEYFLIELAHRSESKRLVQISAVGEEFVNRFHKMITQIKK